MTATIACRRERKRENRALIFNYPCRDQPCVTIRLKAQIEIYMTIQSHRSIICATTVMCTELSRYILMNIIAGKALLKLSCNHLTKRNI